MGSDTTQIQTKLTGGAQRCNMYVSLRTSMPNHSEKCLTYLHSSKHTVKEAQETDAKAMYRTQDY